MAYVDHPAVALAGREAGPPGVLAFSAVSVLFLYLLQRIHGVLPLSLGFKAIDPDQAFNTAASFVTNANWQSYYGEQAMGHLVQTAGLAVRNFASAAVGIAVAAPSSCELNIALKRRVSKS